MTQIYTGDFGNARIDITRYGKIHNVETAWTDFAEVTRFDQEFTG